MEFIWFFLLVLLTLPQASLGNRKITGRGPHKKNRKITDDTLLSFSCISPFFFVFAIDK